MGIKSTISLFSSMLIVLLNMFSSQHCTAINSITPSQPLTHGQTLISPSQFLELGFFVPSNSSTNQYIGIWYKDIYPRKVVWVANKEKPLAVTDSMAVLTIGRNGNLNLLDGNQNTVWSTNISSVRTNTSSSLAVLLDVGNLILKDGVSGEALWEGFDYPCDTMLPTMLNGMNSKTGEKHFYTSWKSEDDPSPGKFVVGLLALVPPQTFIWNGSSPYWRSGQWDKSTFIGIPGMAVSYANGYNLEQDIDQGTAYFSISVFRDLYAAHLVITPSGSFQILYWDQDKKQWQLDWEAPTTLCDVYAVCGPFGVCKMNEKSPTCKCLEGFVPKSDEDWKEGIWRGGCVRRTELLCEMNNRNLTTQERKEDGFVKISKMKLPDISEWQLASDQECQIWCSNNCSCTAYAYVNGIGCMIWVTDLIDLQEFSFSGEDIFIRLAHSELGREEKKREIFIISFTVVSVISVILGAIVFGWWWRKSNLAKLRKNQSKPSSELLKAQLNQEDSSELIMFDIDSIVVATNDFRVTNKLGEGGFGPVYKGKLKDGKEVAVKRLSSSSAQGFEEFRNEILLVSKLQHRNLVKLLGCCIDGEEKLLIYEHMSNKSLDTFIFDPTKKQQLGWVERFNIIQGIARGILYLHQDSSLRIIHRDLKVSNILLDKDMNPKISDFGLARSFLETQDLENTRRVVGTFGYMSPEYAMRGIFSERSDVFSFGVLLLEIVSGQKNTSFHFDNGQHINFLSYAWKLWNENRGLDVMDQVMTDSHSAVEVMRCIHVGLLCVQDHALDRPTMSAVVFMLSNETDRPQPKEPTFTFQRSPDHDQNLCSTNAVTVSLIRGR